MSGDMAGIGIIGAGNMGMNHISSMAEIKDAKLIAVCDIDKNKTGLIRSKYDVKIYNDHKEMLADNEIEAVIIASPHYDHTTIAVDAFKKGIHVLTEKPVGVHVNDIKLMIDSYNEAKEINNDLIFSAMFQQRTYGFWKKIKELIDSGELGKLIRTTWIITNWFRTQFYYDSGIWRATWVGEGGGVLLNQCPHNLDLFQWFVGVPDRITAFAYIGKYHNIEVEDEVTAILEYNNGMTGHFITTTAEAPGTNRLEIAGENGKLVFENEELIFFRNRKSCLNILKNSKNSFENPETWEIKIPFSHHGKSGHGLIIQNFVNAILGKEALLVEGKEGLNSVMMSNAMLLSSHKGKSVDLPLDGNEFESYLKDLIKNSKFKKK
jgi:predicted dehydrogenase